MRLRVTYHRLSELAADGERQFKHGGLLVQVTVAKPPERGSSVELELVTPAGAVVMAASVLHVLPTGIAVAFEPGNPQLTALLERARREPATDAGETIHELVGGAKVVVAVAPVPTTRRGTPAGGIPVNAAIAAITGKRSTPALGVAAAGPMTAPRPVAPRPAAPRPAAPVQGGASVLEIPRPAPRSAPRPAPAPAATPAPRPVTTTPTTMRSIQGPLPARVAPVPRPAPPDDLLAAIASELDAELSRDEGGTVQDPTIGDGFHPGLGGLAPGEELTLGEVPLDFDDPLDDGFVPADELGGPPATDTLDDELEALDAAPARPTRLVDLPMPQKIQLALHGDKAERMQLLRDTNKTVHTYVVRNPTIQLDEINFIARQASVSAEVLAFIASRPEWSQRPEIATALIRNPRTPVPLAIKLLEHVTVAELRNLAKQTGVRDAVQRAARKKLVG